MDEKEIKSIIEQKDTVLCNVNRLAKKGKKGLRFIISEILSRYNSQDYLDTIFSSIAELVFNAIKANYKYILVLEEIEKILTKEKNEGKKVPTIKEITKNENLYKQYYNKIDNFEEIQKQVREILSGEEKVQKIMENAKNENRSINKKEFNEIKKLLKMNAKAKSMKIFVYLNFSFDDEKLIVDIVNNAPISDDNLTRIKNKREKYKKYVEEDNVGQFYLENLDETESAGFGAAMVDARLYDFKVEPYKYFDIWGFQDKTAVTIAFPLKNTEN